MAGMEIDSPSERNSLPSPRERIVQRLILHGVPYDGLNQSPWVLVNFLRDNKSLIPNIVNAIIPSNEDVSEVRKLLKKESGGGPRSVKIKELFKESMLWIQWMMFEGEPQAALNNLVQRDAGQRAVCGAVWGQNDLAYRCRTCEHDPTCAICVPCFQNGNHKDHDYSIMYTGGGCCDCGDETAWKREGFCSKHKGAEQIQPLPEQLVNSVGPVLHALLAVWKGIIIAAEHQENASENRKVAHKLTYAVVGMLLDFCNCSESLLSFISKRMFGCSGLLDVLVRVERFLDKKVVKKLHELLLKLLGEPLFKYEFAKIFIDYYPITVSEMIKECNDKSLEKYPLLSTFSVQIFTVPTLTPRLVREVDLVGVLLGCLMDVFVSCIAEDGRLQANKWGNIYETTVRLVEDTRYVMSHSEVPIYIAQERPDISRAWLRLLSLVQGIDPQKRATGLHMEEDNEDLPKPFVLGHYLGNVHNLLVEGAFSFVESKRTKDNTQCSTDIEGSDDIDRQRRAKVGRLSETSSACSKDSRDDASDCALQCYRPKFDKGDCLAIPSTALWLIFECLKAIDGWLAPGSTRRNNLLHLGATSSSGSNILTWRKKLFIIRKGASSNSIHRMFISRVNEDGDQVCSLHSHHKRFDCSICGEGRELIDHDNDLMDFSDGNDMHPEYSPTNAALDDNLMEMDSGIELESFSVLNLPDWPALNFDVSSHEVSFHIPLHRLLSLLLRKALKTCYSETGKLDQPNCKPVLSSPGCHKFFGQVLQGLQPCGFSAFVMENPLRLRVFCAQVRAGMWRKNGDAAILSSEWYRSVQWLEQGLESDLFLLQCCGALAPPELFVKRIQERFGLLNYTSLNLADHNEYEPVLVQEMLILIIQIVKERRFCGLSTTENLQRELVYKLATGDATHSQLVKALPRDLSKSDQLRNVLDVLAIYSNPSGMKQGKYSLRKAFWKELDLYHPRWNSRDLQVVEERYLRFCKVSALNVQLPRWTAAYEPLSTISKIATSKAVLQIIRAVIFYAVFTEMPSVSRAPDGVLISALHLLSLALDVCGAELPSNEQLCMDMSCHMDDKFPILTYSSEEFDAGAADEVFWKNQSLLSLLVTLMRKNKDENDTYYPESRQCNISSLVENLLKRFAQLSPNCMDNLRRLAPDLICHISHHSVSRVVQNLASTSDILERKAKARERQAAIMEKMRSEQSKFIASLQSAADDVAHITKSNRGSLLPEVDVVPAEAAPVCSLCRDPDSRSPLCFLILLQKSRLTGFVDRGPLSWEDVDRSDRESNLIVKDGVIHSSGAGSTIPVPLDQVAHPHFPYPLQQPEIVFLKGWLSNVRSPRPLVKSDDSCRKLPFSLEMLEQDVYQSIIGEIYDIGSHSHSSNDEKCSSSHVAVDLEESKAADSSVRGVHPAPSSGEEYNQYLSSIYGLLHLANITANSPVSSARFSGFGPIDCDGIHISSCGHAVHRECHDRYLSSLKQRYMRRLGFEGHFVDPDLGELLCPVCRRFSNSILPAFPSASNKTGTQIMLSVHNPSLKNASLVPSDVGHRKLCLPLALSLLRSTAKMVEQGRYQKVFSGKQRVTIEPALEPSLHKLCILYYSQSYDSMSASGRLSPSLILWDTFRYSLVSAEIAARGRVKTSMFGSLSLEALYGELHSSSGFILALLLHVAQSTRSSNHGDVLLRFRGIQLLAGSIYSGVSGDINISSDKRKGTFSEHAVKDEAFPDIQFWKRAADPILAHDPFSSLMWLLYCLPFPFMSSSEFFIPFVHLFYVVCVVQALITCYSRQHLDISCIGDCALNSVCKMMGESEFVRKYFVSNYIDSSCHPKDTIRRFTFPYLRRCALLWKSLQSSTLAPLYDSSQIWDGLKPYTKDNGSDSSKYLTVELNGVRELEDLFQIQSLELVLKDETMHHLALQWCKHFCEVFNIRNCGTALFLTPAVPFKLLQLPRLYQDLLQRYVKLRCPDCKSVPEEPALCLLCGRLCSPSWKQCCRSSRCLSHATVCGAGIGVFLLVRRTTILLQRSSRQAFWPSPYLDAFGEEDLDMYRGRPLYLSEERYAALTYLVASHGLDRTSEVLRQTTISLNGAD